MGVNKFIAIGNLGKDPEVKNLQNDNKVASFSIGISETWKDKSGEKKQYTEWVNCVTWGKLAGIVEKYLKKGSKVYIEGKIKTESYEKEGQTRYITKINVSSLEMLNKIESNNSHISNDNNSTDSINESDNLPW